ncbi:MAG: SCO family protein [Spirochaetia bacterium]
MRHALRAAKRLFPVFSLLLLAAWPLWAAPPMVPLKGNVFSQPWPAADFSLTDQHNRVFHMADTKGKVVVLSFIYTHCTDFCPFIALKLKEAAKLLGADDGRFVMVAVTTDPQRDTPRVNAQYSRAMGMFDSWHFVTGPIGEMRRVWKDYYIGVEMEKETPPAAAAATKVDPKAEKEAQDQAQKVASGLSTEDRTLVGHIIDQFGGGYDVSHDIPFWIVDRQGRMRVSLDADATPADIAFDVRSLLAE